MWLECNGDKVAPVVSLSDLCMFDVEVYIKIVDVAVSKGYSCCGVSVIY
jgi:hypothetical protein